MAGAGAKGRCGNVGTVRSIGAGTVGVSRASIGEVGASSRVAAGGAKCSIAGGVTGVSRGSIAGAGARGRTGGAAITRSIGGGAVGRSRGSMGGVGRSSRVAGGGATRSIGKGIVGTSRGSIAGAGVSSRVGAGGATRSMGKERRRIARLEGGCRGERACDGRGREPLDRGGWCRCIARNTSAGAGASSRIVTIGEARSSCGGAIGTSRRGSSTGGVGLGAAGAVACDLRRGAGARAREVDPLQRAPDDRSGVAGWWPAASFAAPCRWPGPVPRPAPPSRCRLRSRVSGWPILAGKSATRPRAEAAIRCRPNPARAQATVLFQRHSPAIGVSG